MDDESNTLVSCVDDVRYYSDSNIPREDPRFQEDIELDECYMKKEKCINVSIIITISTIIFSSIIMFIIPFV